MGWESVYDSEKGTFLGRTALSWVKILGFYAIYYTLLGFLFYGSVKLGMLRIDNSNILGLTRGINTPVVRSRTDQPGVDAWPQNMVILDNYGQEFELATYEKKYGKGKDEYPVYIQKLEEFLLNHCPFENECSFKNIIGEDWQTKLDFVVSSSKDATADAVGCKPEQVQSRKCLVLNEKCLKTKDSCGKIMEIDHTKLKAQIANTTDNRITKPFFFISINKVIGFELKNYDDLEYMLGLNPKKDMPSPTLQYNPKQDFSLTKDQLKQAAFINCYVFDIEAKKGKCKPWKKTGDVIEKDSDAGNTIPCDNMKANDVYKVSPIQPFILNDNYKYDGYSTDEGKNLVAAIYAKPFAMFQMSMAEESSPIKNLEDKSLIRCNVVAKNIEYPYLESEQLMGNALLGQPGHGWVQLGFRTLEVEQEK